MLEKTNYRLIPRRARVRKENVAREFITTRNRLAMTEMRVSEEEVGQMLEQGIGMDTAKRYIAIAKWIGASVIIVVALSGIILSSLAAAREHPMDYEVKIDDENRTACVFVKRYDLRDGIYLTVCNLGGEVIIDIRRFLNGTATIRGIPLNLKQWLTLKQITSTVDTAINEARTYWKELKEMK